MFETSANKSKGQPPAKVSVCETFPLQGSFVLKTVAATRKSVSRRAA